MKNSLSHNFYFVYNKILSFEILFPFLFKKSNTCLQQNSYIGVFPAVGFEDLTGCFCVILSVHFSPS